MDLVDEVIHNDIENTKQMKDISWLKPIVHVRPQENNPFISPDLEDLSKNDTVVNDEIGQLFCVPGCEMAIKFPPEFDHSQSHSAQKGRSQAIRGIAKAFNRSSVAHLGDINNTFSCAESNITSESKADIRKGKAILQSFSYELLNFNPNANMKMIEPILCTLFIYNDTERKIVSDYWNFIPPNSVPLFKDSKMKADESISASFLVDPGVMDENSFFVMLLSHPTSEDNGATVIKYYQNPTVQNEQAAVKKLSKSFPKIKECFSIFAATFTPFSRSGFTMPAPFFYESPMLEKDIHDFIIEAQKKFKQMTFTIAFKGINESPLIIRPIYRKRLHPYLSPIHQLIVRLDSASSKLSASHKSNNLMVSISLLNKETKLKCIQSKLFPLTFESEVFSRCVYHSRTPDFDDMFLINLPQPIEGSMSLQFKLYHSHIKKSEKGLDVIGRANVPLYSNSHGLFLSNGDHSIHLIPEGSSKNNPDKSLKLTFTTLLRSNLVTDDSKYLIFLKSKGPVMSLLSKLPQPIVICNMMLILNRIIKSYFSEKDISFLPFVYIRDQALNVMAPDQFEKFLNIFVRYFALRDFVPKRSVENDKSLHTSTSLIDLTRISEKPTFEMNSIGAPSSLNPQEESLIDLSEANIKKNQTVPLHNKLISCFTRTIEANNLEYLANLIDFIFSLTIKSLAMHAKVDFIKDFDIFVKAFIKAVKNDMKNVQKYSKSIALFVNLLFDVGLAAISAKVSKHFIEEFIQSNGTFSVVLQYIKFAFRPSLFYYSMKHIEEFRNLIIKLFDISFKEKSLYDVFAIILHLFSCYDEEQSGIISSLLLPCIKNLKPNQLPATTEIVAILTFLTYILEHANPDVITRFMENDETAFLFNLCHFILRKVTPKEMTYVRNFYLSRTPTFDMPEIPSKIGARQRRETMRTKKDFSKPLVLPTQVSQPPTGNFSQNNSSPSVNEIINLSRNSLIRFANTFLSVASLNEAYKLLLLMFHMINDENLDCFYFNQVIDIISDLLNQFSPGIFQCTQPCIVRLIDKIFEVSVNRTYMEFLVKPIVTLFEADQKSTGTIDHANAFCVRSLSLMKYEQLTNEDFENYMSRFENIDITGHFFDTFIYLKNVATYLEDPKLSSELRHDFVFYRFNVLCDSPDAQYECLGELYDLHAEQSNYNEMIYVLYMQVALVMEILTINNLMPNYFGVQHPAQLFQDECPLVSCFECDKVVKVPSFADSVNFCEHGIIVNLSKIFKLAVEAKLYDKAIGVIDYIWPLLEQRRLFGQLDYFFTEYNKMNIQASEAPKVRQPFFKVSFFGEVFMKENGKTFIYREKQLTNLFEFADSIVKKYQTISADSKIELISDSDTVDVSALDPEKNYIQVTFVEPYKPSPFSKSSNKFYFDRPFVPGEKKKQGNITTQWIARTICTAKYPLPSVVRRSIVESIDTKDYEPIINAYRQIRKRTETMEQAIEQKDQRQVQQLLHGSLIVTVNEGPEKIAEAFLKDGPDSKGKEKLKIEFIRLLKILRVGVKFHGEWVTNNTEFVPLQVQLEEGLSEFVSKLGTMIDPELLK